jgi:hypothetical protein
MACASGIGCVPLGGAEFTTALFPKDGRYLVPVKVAVQRAEAIGKGAVAGVALRLNVVLASGAVQVGQLVSAAARDPGRCRWGVSRLQR